MNSINNLEEYHKKRDFSSTKEPFGDDKPSSSQPIFVIQKHDASNLHYDMRIEIEGVLKSWAVPKGPSTDTTQQRMAIPTEDHPLEYADFESVIPEGEYGAGPVMVWDAGEYLNLRKEKKDDQASMQKSYEQGKIEIFLQGKKLVGGYALIRTES